MGIFSATSCIISVKQSEYCFVQLVNKHEFFSKKTLQIRCGKYKFFLCLFRVKMIIIYSMDNIFDIVEKSCTFFFFFYRIAVRYFYTPVIPCFKAREHIHLLILFYRKQRLLVIKEEASA